MASQDRPLSSVAIEVSRSEFLALMNEISLLRKETSRDRVDRNEKISLLAEKVKVGNRGIEKIYKGIGESNEILNGFAISMTPAMDKKKSLTALQRSQFKSVDYYMTPDFQMVVFTNSITRFIEKKIREGTVITDPFMCIRLLMVSRERGPKAVLIRSTEGSLFQEMRVKIVKSVIFNCRCVAQREGGIEDLDQSDEVNNASGSRRARSRSLQLASTAPDSDPSIAGLRNPMWIKKGFVKLDVVDALCTEMARNDDSNASSGNGSNDGIEEHSHGTGAMVGLETQSPAAKKRKVVASAPLSLEDAVSTEVVRACWLKGTLWFNSARADFRKAFVVELGFLFYEGCSPEWTYKAPAEYFFRGSTLPDATVGLSNLESVQIDEQNRSALQRMCDEYPLLSFVCSYKVQVFMNDADAARMSVYGEERILTRNLSLMQVALILCSDYFQSTSTYSFLQSTPRALRMVFWTACALARALDAADAKRKAGKSAEECYSEFKGVGLCLKSKQAQVALVEESSLRMSVSRYGKLSGQGGGSVSVERREGNADGGGISDDEDICDEFAGRTLDEAGLA